MSGAARYPWWMGLAGWLGAALLRLLGSTWRIDRSGLAAYEKVIDSGERCIYVLWHACLLPLTYTHRDRDVAVLISRHQDGELIARIVERLGYRTARGSSTRGAEAGARAMIDYAGRGHLLAITPDGPRGPAETLKVGLVRIASVTGRPVLPVAAAAVPAWWLRSWDRFRVPKPFSRVVVASGEPLVVPPSLDEDETERWRVRIETALREHTAAVRARAKEVPA